LAFMKHRKEASKKAQDYKQYLNVLNAQQLGVDPKLVGLPGSPTIVYKVEKIPKAKPTRRATMVDGSDRGQIVELATKISQILSGAVVE